MSASHAASAPAPRSPELLDPLRYGGARHSELSGGLTNRIALGPKASKLLQVHDPTGPAYVLALGPGASHPGPDSLNENRTLELREHGRQGEERLAQRRAGV